ncbi:hypothetical protein TNCV_4851091 [Trichonephila clavipes]|nr:hypothetical protein TNCV_4851091 [Trichonephila clavipes]
MPSANNFIIPHLGQTILDKSIGERLSPANFRTATVGNTVKGLKNPGSRKNQLINPPEEPDLIANGGYDEPKKPVSVFYFKPLPKATQTDIAIHFVLKKLKGANSVLSKQLYATLISRMRERCTVLARLVEGEERWWALTSSRGNRAKLFCHLYGAESCD